MDLIDLSLALDSAVALFGPFICYIVCSSQQQLPPVHDAFALMMASQKQLSQQGLPIDLSVCTCTKMDKLYNDFVT